MTTTCLLQRCDLSLLDLEGIAVDGHQCPAIYGERASLSAQSNVYMRLTTPDRYGTIHVTFEPLHNIAERNAEQRQADLG